jgi:hypothetical protein
VVIEKFNTAEAHRMMHEPEQEDTLESLAKESEDADYSRSKLR